MRLRAIVFLTVLPLAACEQNSASVVILQNQVPGDGCSMDSSGDTFRTQGTLDVAWYLRKQMPTYYDMYLLVKNQLQSTEETTGIEENCVTVKEARVDLDLGPLGSYVEESLTKYKVPVSLMLCPGEQKVVTVRVVLPQVVQLIADQIQEGSTDLAVADVYLVTERGSFEIDSNHISYPIFLCNGCLVQDLGLCDSATIPESPKVGNPCNPAQDDVIECCSQGTNLLCPAVSTSDASS